MRAVAEVRPSAPRIVWREIARRLVMGQKQSDIAADMRRAPSVICNTIQRKEFQDILQEEQDKRSATVYDVQGHFKTHLASACSTISSLIDDEEATPGVRLGAAKEILKQAGFGVNPSTVINNRFDEVNMSFEQRVELAEKRLRDEGKILDLPYQPDPAEHSLSTGDSASEDSGWDGGEDSVYEDNGEVYDND